MSEIFKKLFAEAQVRKNKAQKDTQNAYKKGMQRIENDRKKQKEREARYPKAPTFVPEPGDREGFKRFLAEYENWDKELTKYRQTIAQEELNDLEKVSNEVDRRLKEELQKNLNEINNPEETESSKQLKKNLESFGGKRKTRKFKHSKRRRHTKRR